jgi:carboxypeptidase D
MMYDPTIGAFDNIQQQLPTVPFVKANNEHFRFNDELLEDIDIMHKSCGHRDFFEKYFTFPPPSHQPPSSRKPTCNVFDRVQWEVRATNRCFNVYEISQRCPKLSDVMKGRMPYFNRPEVKTALHVPQGGTWSECSKKRVFVGPRGRGPQREGDLSADPIQKVLPQVISATNRVLVANGDYDMVIITNGTLLAIQNMTWNGLLGFQQRPVTPINVPVQGNMGVSRPSLCVIDVLTFPPRSSIMREVSCGLRRSKQAIWDLA